MDDALPPVLDAFVRRHLTLEEIDEIRHQFSRALVTDRQVLWTGMTREAAQRWADKHNMQTLTTAMGPLMSHNEVSASGTKLRSRSTRYIHGASAIFAWCISYGKMVTVLSNPPPVRFHPSGATSFQVIEEPIITGRVGSHAVARIDVVHPAISAAAEFRYEFWPCDDVSRWITTFGHLKITVKWRPVKRAQLYLNDGAKYIDKSTESLTARPLLQKQFAQNNVSTGDMKLHELQQKQLNLNNEVTEKRERLHRKHVNEVARLQSDFRNARNGLPKKAKKRQELHGEEVRSLKALKTQQMVERMRLETEERTARLHLREERRAANAKLRCCRTVGQQTHSGDLSQQVRPFHGKIRSTGLKSGRMRRLGPRDIAVTEQSLEHQKTQTTNQQHCRARPFWSFSFFLRAGAELAKHMRRLIQFFRRQRFGSPLADRQADLAALNC